MGYNPWIDNLLSICGNPEGEILPFECSDIAGFTVDSADCTTLDYCCRAMILMEFIASVCDQFPPSQIHRLRFGNSLPGETGNLCWRIDQKFPSDEFWVSTYGSGCAFQPVPWGNYCDSGFNVNYFCALPSECCCGECMATCDDLVNKLTETNNSIMCLAQRIDCIIEVIGQSWMDRTYTANHMANVERILVNNTNQISQALMAIAQGVSEVGIPIPQLPPETTLDPLENTELGCAGPSPDFCAAVPPP